MRDERTRPSDAQETIDERDHDEAILVADDTGMVSGQRLAVETEITEHLDETVPEGDTEL
ncbi:MAG: hypothetical protein M3N13_01040 [Candidatus Eremiobacteraeota bacterium]|nr:hypothetical protein [Candidatus Eremiobacteraeota bacterium]